MMNPHLQKAIHSPPRADAGSLVLRRLSRCGGLLVVAYRFRILRPLVRQLLNRWEGGIMYSATWRRIYQVFEGVSIGYYSYGPGIKPGVLPRGTVIGHFCSLAVGLQVFRRNHTINRISQHPFFYNHNMGLVKEDTIPDSESNPLIIGSDVWIGMNTIICAGCRAIGDGAVIGAGSIVTKDVPPYTIVAGNPARPLRKRFSPAIEAVVIASRWWLRPLPELIANLDLFTQDITDETIVRLASAFPERTVASENPRTENIYERMEMP